MPDLCAPTELCRALGNSVRRFIAEWLASRFFFVFIMHPNQRQEGIHLPVPIRIPEALKECHKENKALGSR